MAQLKFGNGEKVTVKNLVSKLLGSEDEIHLFLNTINEQGARVKIIKNKEGELEAQIEAKAYVKLLE